MPHKRRRPHAHYAPRRVPDSFNALYLRLRLAPILPSVAAAVALGAVAGAGILPTDVRERLRLRAGAIGDDTSERSQRLFFDQPGLDTLLVRTLTHVAAAGSSAARAYSRVRALADSSYAVAGHLLPRGGYDALMTGMLSAGMTLGNMRGGDVHVARIYDDHTGDSLTPVDGHPTPELRRFEAPRQLSDMAADIDDLYWAMARGMTVKITRAGQGSTRRWVVSLPGTDHFDGSSTANPADMESNLREALNLPSAARIGLVRALHDAMRADGVPSEDLLRDPVLICGHSQGGLIAVALAAETPEQSGINVTGILAMGTPGRRMRIRPDVTMLAVEHDQDIVPSLDGMPARAPDHRVVVGRRLVRPQTGALYYAHSSSTYTETVGRLERRVAVTPWDRLGRAAERLRAMLPAEGEDSRVYIYEIWQDLREETPRDVWDVLREIATLRAHCDERTEQ